MAKTTIVVEARTNDYKAFIEADPACCGYGRTIQSAIGALLLGHRDQFEVAIKEPTRNAP
ncbi:MAG: hypothetical protein UX54_C0004G0006 [Parcubacteria group bacterium GW2011_GWA2_46_39]|nr:MAG: hypothetical protein UX54_C0004G0006 [Parcubacteria group bacterium GW2011_GWA2_46_39]